MGNLINDSTSPKYNFSPNNKNKHRFHFIEQLLCNRYTFETLLTGYAISVSPRNPIPENLLQRNKIDYVTKG